MIEILRSCTGIKIFSSNFISKLYLNNEYIATLNRYDMKFIPLFNDNYLWIIWEGQYRYLVLPSINSYYCEIKSQILYHQENNFYSFHEFASGLLGLLIALFIILLWYGL